MIPKQPEMMAAAIAIRDFVWRLGLGREETLSLLCAIYAGFAVVEVTESDWPLVEADEVQRLQLHLRAAQQAEEALLKEALRDMPVGGSA